MKGLGSEKNWKRDKTDKGKLLQRNDIISQAFNLHSKGDILEAEKLYRFFIDQGYNDPRVLTNYGNIEKEKGNIKNAIKLYKISIEKYPDFVLTYFNLANILKDEKKKKDAEIYYRKAIKLDPQFAFAYNNLASLLLEQGKYIEAELLFNKAITIDENCFDAYNNLGATYKELRQFDKAELYIKKAIDINNKFADAYANLGNMYRGIDKLSAAEKYLQKALEIEPDLLIALKGLIDVYLSLGEYPKAKELAFKSLRNNQSSYQLNFLLLKLFWITCDWDLLDNQLIRLDQLNHEIDDSGPMIFMYLEDEPMKQLNRSIAYNDINFRINNKQIELVSKSKIRIGYFSNGFYQHSTMVLLARIIELHNKNRFEIYIYDFGCHQEDNYTKRIKDCVDKYSLVNHLSDEELVEIARKDDLDIAIDLMGYTKFNRAIIFSYRLAPIQVSYLDYPGSTGNKSIDYILADKILIPKKDDIFYTEQVVRMPHALQPTDDKLIASDIVFDRSCFGFREDQFVFSCFAASKKIQRREFSIWMDLLLFNKNSVLWLLYSNETAKNNILNEANLKGINSSRITFSKFIDIRDHMNRQDCADLQLDTFNFNSGTMTCLSLMTGLPIVTLPGNTYSSRLTASVLTELGLNDLIAESETDYFDIAKKLSTNKNLLSDLKERLRSLRRNSPYFDSKKYCNDLENIFIKMIHNHPGK